MQRANHRSSASTRSIRNGEGMRRSCSGRSRRRRAVNPLTGEIWPVTYIGQMIPGSGYSCGVITPTTPCQINGVVIQENGNYVDGGRGFFNPPGVQFDPRFGLAWAANTRTVVRAAAGEFHEGSGG